MLTAALAASFMVVIPSTVLAQDLQNGAPNPDHPVMPLDKHLVLQVGVGPSISSVDAGDVHVISFHVHVATMVGGRWVHNPPPWR